MYKSMQSMRRLIADDDIENASQSSSDDSTYNKLGETLVHATKFLGKLVRDSRGIEHTDSYEDPNLDVDRYRRSLGSVEGEKQAATMGKESMAELNQRYNEANDGNLYKCLRSVRHTNDGMGNNGIENDLDELSFSDIDEEEEGSEMSMPRISEHEGDVDESRRTGSQSGSEADSLDDVDEEGSTKYVPTRQMHQRRASEHSIRSISLRRCSNGTESSAVKRRNELHRQSSDVSTHVIPSGRRGSNEANNVNEHGRSRNGSRRGTQSSSESNGTSRGNGLLRAMGLSREDSSRSIFSGNASTNADNNIMAEANRRTSSRRSSTMSTATEDSSEDNNAIKRWFGISGSLTRKSSNGNLQGLNEDELSVANANNNEGFNGSSASLLGGMKDSYPQDNTPSIASTTGVESFTDHHARSRSNFMKKNVSHATANSESFRKLQRRMKEKGAITGSSIRHMLQDAAEEHAVINTRNNENHELNSNDVGIDMLACLDGSESFVEQQQQQQPWYVRNGGGGGSSIRSTVNHEELILQQQHNEERAREKENEERAREKELRRLERDPMFGVKSSSNDDASNAATVHHRPYITIPSRETNVEQSINVVCNAADQGHNSMLTIRGSKFVGKSKLLQKVIDTVQIQGFGYTVLKSRRTSCDALTSYFAFREIMSMALRACDAVTQRSDESFHNQESNNNHKRRGSGNGENSDQAGMSSSNHENNEQQENDESIVQRLIQRKILNKLDQLMIGRILPDVMNKQLLSLLKGRNPAALTKDIVGSLFKVLIPLQPVMLVFEADGDDCKVDPSSWDIIEELLLSASKHCPQMIVIVMSRQALEVPQSIIEHEKHIDIEIDSMDKEDTECYIRALFCDPNCLDRNMMVDEHVVDGVYDRARGCPLFTERIVLWSQRKEVLEMDETRNAVALNLPHNDDDKGPSPKSSLSLDKSKETMLLKTLPANLNEEILEVINNLPHHLLDALKVAACIGITFNVEKYKALKDELGFHHSLQEIMGSHGIFDETNGRCYRWKHVAVYEAVESIIISNERIEIQGRIADSILHSPNLHRGNNAQYARHYVMAERWDDAFDRYMEAGDKAEEKLDFVGAVGVYQQAKMCLSKSRKKPSLRRRLSPHAALGWCLRELVRYEDAEHELEFCLKQTMAVPERRRNSQFKEIELDVVTTLATLKQAQSKYVEAMEMYERVLPIARSNKEKHARVWLAHHVASCADIHRKSGDLEQAKTLHTEALGYRELAVEEHSCTILELALSFTQLGCTLSGLGDHSAAYSLHKKALAARMEHLDFYHSLTSESLNYCADALSALGRGGEGIPLGMHAVKIRKFVFGPHHPAYAHALSVLASCYHSVGRSFDSLGLLKECLEICEKAFSKNHANMIPNLMLYGSVLSVAGNLEKARDVYERALSIHTRNFKEGQNAQQLVKLQNAMEELSSNSGPHAKKVACLEMPIPSFEHDSSKTHVIVCADIGHRASDEYMLSVAASLQKMGSLKLISVIAVSPPQVVRADIARGALDSLLLSNIPVAYSGVVSSPSSSRTANTATFNADYGKPSAHVNNTGVELITRALLKAPEKSLVIMCTACLGDVSEVIDTHRDLFARKVKQVVVIGSVKPVRRRNFIEPEDYGGAKDDAFARNVYKSCQELQIPTVTLFKDISRGFPFPSTHVDDLTSSNHMVSTKIQRSEEMQMNGIWELIKQLKQEARSFRTPKSLDEKSFYKYSLGGNTPNVCQHNIWPLIKSINLELVLGLLSCIPMYQEAHFRWETHQVKGIDHKVCRHSNSTAGIIKPEALSNEIHMLIGFSFRTSLLNTSC